MTATPHNGKEEDFQLFLSLLDSDRFYGKFRDGAHKVDVTDLMRRMVKEDLLKFDGTPLFPERRAYTANYKLSDLEAALYAAVTDYVKNEMNRADQLQDGKRKGTVGFALTPLQRRLASSPEAIYQSLKRRRNKLKRRVEEEKLRQRGQSLAETLGASGVNGVPEDIWESADALSPDDYENFEEAVVDQATAAQTIQELEAEIVILEGLEEQARQVVHSGQDRKWDELSRPAAGHARDARRRRPPAQADHLHRAPRHAELPRRQDSRPARQRRGRGRSSTAASTATSAARSRSCSATTRTSRVLRRHRRRRRRRQPAERQPDGQLRPALEPEPPGAALRPHPPHRPDRGLPPVEPGRRRDPRGRCLPAPVREAGESSARHLGGRVFDILGEVFEDSSLKDLLIEAIRYGDDPEVRARLLRKVEGALDTEHLEDHHQAQRPVRRGDGRASACSPSRRRWRRPRPASSSPIFIRSFFTQAFQQLGGELRPRESGRYEITHVPANIRERDRQITGRDRRNADPVLRRYERVCFEKQFVRLIERAGAPMASLLHPGHPLMQSVTDLVLEAAPQQAQARRRAGRPQRRWASSRRCCS